RVVAEKAADLDQVGRVNHDERIDGVGLLVLDQRAELLFQRGDDLGAGHRVTSGCGGAALILETRPAASLPGLRVTNPELEPGRARTRYAVPESRDAPAAAAIHLTPSPAWPSPWWPARRRWPSPATPVPAAVARSRCGPGSAARSAGPARGTSSPAP